MFGNRKRFLRDGDAIVNLDHVQIIQYMPDERRIYFWFGKNDRFTMCDKSPADFEKIVRAVKCGRAGK
jgi:hypothetical protein